MRSSRITWGLIFIFAGSLIVLENFGIIDFQWTSIWRFWPLLLILGGANMLLDRNNSSWGAVVMSILTIAALSFVTWTGMKSEPDYTVSWMWNESNKKEGSYKSFEFKETRSNERYAELHIAGGGTSFSIKDTSSSLLTASVKSRDNGYSLKKLVKDSIAILNLRLPGSSNGDDSNIDSHTKINIALNPDVIWDLKVQTGASSANCDMTNFKLRKFDFASGASKLKLKLGQPLDRSEVNIDAGVSSITIMIPKDAACSVSSDSGLSSLDTDDLNKIAENVFQSPDYSTAKTRFTIKLSGGLTSFSIKRY